jgi:hypothetical protein
MAFQKLLDLFVQFSVQNADQVKAALARMGATSLYAWVQ